MFLVIGQGRERSLRRQSTSKRSVIETGAGHSEALRGSRLRQTFIGSAMTEFGSDAFRRFAKTCKHPVGERLAVGARERKRLRQCAAEFRVELFL